MPKRLVDGPRALEAVDLHVTILTTVSIHSLYTSSNALVIYIRDMDKENVFDTVFLSNFTATTSPFGCEYVVQVNAFFRPY